jgi:hypothetical protein
MKLRPFFIILSVLLLAALVTAQTPRTTVGRPGSDVGPSTGSSRAFFDNSDHDLLMKAVTKQKIRIVRRPMRATHFI